MPNNRFERTRGKSARRSSSALGPMVEAHLDDRASRFRKWRSSLSIGFGILVVLGGVNDAVKTGKVLFALASPVIGGAFTAYGLFGPRLLVNRLAWGSRSSEPWREYRQRRRQFLGIWLGGFIACAMAMKLLFALDVPAWVSSLLIIGWIIAFLVGG